MLWGLITGFGGREMIYGLRTHFGSDIAFRNGFLHGYSNARFSETLKGLWDSLEKSVDDAVKGFNRLSFAPEEAPPESSEPSKANW